MLFSVILPIYNVERYLSQCIDSVLAQTCADYELILVNDGSTDGSGAICDEYHVKYPTIKVIHKENGGLSDARNVGTRNASGEYIIYIDSDDYIIKDTFFEQVAEQIKQQQSDIVLYKFQSYLDESNQLLPCSFSMAQAADIQDADQLLMHLVERDAFYASAWTKVVRRTLLVENKLWFEKGLTGEDNDWYLHVLTVSSCRISALDEAFIAYRQRANSISHTYKLKNLVDYIYVLEKWQGRVAEANISALRKEALYGAMAKYYVHLLIGYIRVADEGKKEYRNRIRALHTLLRYGKSKRPRLAAKVWSLLGFRGTVFMLSVLDKLKG